MQAKCRICSNSNHHRTFSCCEKMYALGDSFEYFQCAVCGCLQIAEPARDLSRYYPPQYYSFRKGTFSHGRLRNWLAGQRDRSAAIGTGHLGQWLLKHTGRPRPDLASLGRVPAKREMRILDVGCGGGQLLSLLHRAGFLRVMGTDPLLAADREIKPGLWIRRLAVEEVEGQFDLIMLHHVLEHVEQPRDMLTACRRRLAPGGKILLRVPTVECAAWERYQIHWVQLDAPRHIFLFTRAGLTLLAEQCSLEVRDCWCDSSGFQFWGSELYVRGVPIFNSEGRMADPGDYFTAEELRRFDREAAALNAAGRGDQIALVLA
jgi:2-polyprenyl-3-methyl-5-hydroxy-6-metoxy-1,4-benzoquinol methylase